MIAHHEQAIEMAEIAQDPARQAGAEVVALAGRIEAAQDPEIELMTGWLEAWGQPVQMDTSDGHDMSEMTGMMSAEDMDALATKTGTEFDDMWLTMMVEHHEGAIEMATDDPSRGHQPRRQDPRRSDRRRPTGRSRRDGPAPRRLTARRPPNTTGCSNLAVVVYRGIYYVM